jgi:ribosomal protein S18 acetylase RimI-like enzyme
MTFRVRDATLDDMEAVRELVIELAVYEKEPVAVSATVDDYKRNFKDGVFDAIVVVEVSQAGSVVVGMAVFQVQWSTWKGRMLYLEDLLVTAAYRRRGLGKMLFDDVLRRGKERDCQVMKWQVLDWNTPAQAFYATYDAAIEKDWWTCKIKNLQNKADY